MQTEFNGPYKGAVLATVGNDGLITVTKLPADTTLTANTLRTAPLPETIYSATDEPGAAAAIDSQLQAFQG